jgi:hypothetical protein
MLSPRLTPALAAAMLSLTACGYDPETGCDSGKGDSLGDPPDGVPVELLQCRDREPEVREAAIELIADLEAGNRPDITDVDSFLAALPAGLKKNTIFLTDSRSMARVYPAQQKFDMLLSSPDGGLRNPHVSDEKWCVDVAGKSFCVESRVLITSNSSDFIGSFTTHPDGVSAERFELVLFDPSLSRLTLVDIDFSDGRAVVEKNPPSCMGCHAAKAPDGKRDLATMNWRFDPYRFWPYATPFNQDNLRRGSVEVEWYDSFWNRILAGEDKLRHLDLFNSPETIAREIDSQGEFRLSAEVNIGGHQSPALNMHHQLLEKNGCRATASFLQHENFDRIKYAALGAMLDCPNVEEFLPAQGFHSLESAHAYFESMRDGLVNGRFSLGALHEQTTAQSELLFSDRLSRRFDHFVEFVGEDRALAEIEESVALDDFGVSNFETFTRQIAKTRFLLEPLGIDVTQWSMAVDPTMPSHVEFFYLFMSQPAYIDLLADEFGVEVACENGLNTGRSCYRQAQNADVCEPLAEASRQALAALGPVAHFRNDYQVEDLDQLEQAARARAGSSSLEELRDSADFVYTVRCAACHPAQYDLGAPYLPFDARITELEEMFRRGQQAALRSMNGRRIGTDSAFVGRSQSFHYVQVADRIWDRVNRHPRQHGAMPKVGFLTHFDNQAEVFPPLTTEEKVAIRAHMLKVQEAR